MTEGIVIALIGMIGLVIAGMMTIIGQQLSAKNTARERHDAIHAQLDEAKDARETIKADVHSVKAELPEGGLQAWTDTIAGHTEQLRKGALALDRLAESMTTITGRLDEHDAVLAELRSGGTA